MPKVTIDLEKKTVTREVEVRLNKDDLSPLRTEWVLDYSNCDLEDLLERASRTDAITLQARYRVKPFDVTSFDVAVDLPGKAGVTMSAKDRLIREAKRLTQDELAEALRTLGVEVK